MMGMLGLAVDAGRMFICKDELQAFVDASAMAAVARLDGTQAGLTAANNLATAGPLGATKPNGYNFGTSTVSTVTNTYATSFTGSTYDSYATASAPATNNYRFIRVTASANVPLNFLPVMPGISSLMSLTATATAGENPSSTLSGNMLPFAPDAHNQADHDELRPYARHTIHAEVGKWKHHHLRRGRGIYSSRVASRRARVCGYRGRE